MDLFDDHDDNDDSADGGDDEDYTTATYRCWKNIPLPRWFPAWKDEGGGAVEASWPEDRAPGETELFEFHFSRFFVGNLDVKIIVLILRLRWALGAP